MTSAAELYPPRVNTVTTLRGCQHLFTILKAWISGVGRIAMSGVRYILSIRPNQVGEAHLSSYTTKFCLIPGNPSTKYPWIYVLFCIKASDGSNHH